MITVRTKFSQQAQHSTGCFSEEGKNETCPFPEGNLQCNMLSLNKHKHYVIPKKYNVQQGLIFLKIYSQTLISSDMMQCLL